MSAPLLHFRHGGQHFVIETRAVSEVIALPRMTRLPSPPPFLRGVVNHHGSVLPVADTDELLGVPAGRKASTGDTALVLAENDARVVLPVEATVGLEQGETQVAGRDPGTEPVVSIAGRAVNVLRLDDLLARIEGGGARPRDGRDAGSG